MLARANSATIIRVEPGREACGSGRRGEHPVSVPERPLGSPEWGLARWLRWALGPGRLFRAARAGNAVRVQALLARGVDPNARGPWRMTALHAAAEKGHAEVVRLLLDHCAVVDADSSLHPTPLFAAVYWGHADAARVLLERGARRPVLPEWFSPRDEAVVRLLVEYGADVNHEGEHGATALHAAAASGLEALAQFLLAHGADPTIRDAAGRTPLTYAEDGGHRGIAQLLRRSSSAR